jgi:inhibitor of cysteine peptidase
VIYKLEICYNIYNSSVKREIKMKNFVILSIVAVVGICILAGCTREREGLKTYTDSNQIIGVSVRQEFVIALDSNITTGYSWQISYDQNMLELVEKTYEQNPNPRGLVGVGGVEYFRFKALNIGETEITFVYKRSWEEPTPQDETKVFIVRISLYFLA